MLCSGLKKRIFLLTDGDVSNPQEVIELARSESETSRVFSFGLGSGCDQNLVKNSAIAGRGTYTIVKDNDPNLNGLVIKALSCAMEPSLKEVQYGFFNELNNPHEIYRNTLVCPSKIMSEAEFGDLTFTFKAK